MKNYLVEIKESQNVMRQCFTVYASDDDHAQQIGEALANALYQGFYESPTFYVDSVTALE